MKKLLLFTALVMGSMTARSQCVYTCSNYAVSPITYTTFPSGTLNVTPSFTNPFLGTWADDGSTGPIPIGFNFDFFCNTYTDVWICSNGFITFSSVIWPNQYVHPTQSLPNSADPNNMVAFNMTDLDPGVGGTITYTTVGTSPNRIFIVTFSDVPSFGQSDLSTGQIVLRETSNIIEIHTNKANACTNQGALGSTQGIENQNGSAAFYPPNRNANNTWPGNATNSAYMFAPYTAPPLGAISGNTILCEGSVGNYIVPTASAALSYSWSGPASWTGSSTTSAATFTAGATGAVSVTAQYTCGSTKPSTLMVNVLPAPVVGITSVTPAIICSGKTVEVHMSGAAVYTLQPGNGIGVSPMLTTPMVPTVFTVTGTDSAGCTSLNQATASVLVLETPTVTVNSGTVCQGQPFTMTPSGANQYSFSVPFSTVTNTVVGVHTYSVIGTSTNGCKGQAISTLSVSGLPQTTVSANRTTMCRNETVTLTASGALNFAWSSTVSTAPVIVMSPTNSAVHTVTGTTAEGCVKTATVFIQVNPCTGLQETGSPSYRIYPNPSAGEFVLESQQAETITVYDLLGREVKKYKVSAGLNTISADLPEGRYFIKGNDSGIHQSFVISRN